MELQKSKPQQCITDKCQESLAYVSVLNYELFFCSYPNSACNNRHLQKHFDYNIYKFAELQGVYERESGRCCGIMIGAMHFDVGNPFLTYEIC